MTRSADAAIYTLPVRSYIGLDLANAEAQALREGRTIRVKENLDDVGRASFGFRRVNVQLGPDGTVAAARRVRPPKGLGVQASMSRYRMAVSGGRRKSWCSRMLVRDGDDGGGCCAGQDLRPSHGPASTSTRARGHEDSRGDRAVHEQGYGVHGIARSTPNTAARASPAAASGRWPAARPGG